MTLSQDFKPAVNRLILGFRHDFSPNRKKISCHEEEQVHGEVNCLRP